MNKGIIFDMDGVLIDAMPFHAEAMRIAINEETGYDIDKKIVYFLEGMPGHSLVKEIFKRENINKDIDDGKPHSSPFQTALQRMHLKPSEAIVVENAPLGVEAAIRAGIEYIITLNNTPLDIFSDFKGTISNEDRKK